MPKFKKFDKKNSVTFKLVHRSQQDPLVADEDAPQRVLLPIEEKKGKEKRLEEQEKYGIHFKDDSNYLEHLKDPKDNKMSWPEHVEEELARKIEKTKVQLPHAVFASEQEEEIGMLAKAAPTSGLQLNLDSDLVAAMEDDFNYSDPNNVLEDNFIDLAMGVADQEIDEDEEFEMDSNFDDSDMSSDVASQKSVKQLETKSKLTKHSMTSSVIRRTDELKLLDRRFEKMYEKYDDSEIGALDCEEIEGYIPETSDILLQHVEEFEKSQKREQLDQHNMADKIKEKILEQDSDEEYVYVPIQEKERWDCETILSTNSNLYNHPKLICEPPKNKIKIDKKTGIPKNVLGTNKLTVQAVSELDEQNIGSSNQGTRSIGAKSVISHLSELSLRPKDETPEERRDRKKQIKEYRKERRLEKKLNTLAFKQEKQRQTKININNKNNVQGNKIL